MAYGIQWFTRWGQLRTFWGDKNNLYLNWNLGYTGVYICQNSNCSLRSVHFTVFKKKKANWELCVSGALSSGGFHCRDLSGLFHWKVSNFEYQWTFFLAWEIEARMPVFWEPSERGIIHYVDCHLMLLFSVLHPSPSAGLSVPTFTVSSLTSQTIKPLVFCMC